MPKHKPKRGAPTIDMTAMTDVAFLLLTFFMLTAKMKPSESVVVDTPSSISDTKLPDAGTLTLLVSKEGAVHLDMVGQHTRMYLIENVDTAYKLNLTQDQKVRFANGTGFGVSREKLKQFLSTEDNAAKEALQKNGIPIDTADINKSELADWVHRARLAQFEMKKQDKVKEEYVIVIKADRSTPYPAVQKVINTLVDINVNKFNLITNTEAKPGAEKE